MHVANPYQLPSYYNGDTAVLGWGRSTICCVTPNLAWLMRLIYCGPLSAHVWWTDRACFSCTSLCLCCGSGSCTQTLLHRMRKAQAQSEVQPVQSVMSLYFKQAASYTHQPFTTRLTRPCSSSYRHDQMQVIMPGQPLACIACCCGNPSSVGFGTQPMRLRMPGSKKSTRFKEAKRTNTTPAPNP